ncbi:MAG: ribonuclease HII [Candidatus Tectomicrobia bacterium]|nr:ribonuclease HII [Candidatus Tectomicrobia bacterium]
MLAFDRECVAQFCEAGNGAGDVRTGDGAASPALVAGVDEVGRGPLAGPVVAAAVVLPPSPELWGLRDSKRLTVRQREALFGAILREAVAVALGAMSPRAIEAQNILRATQGAMLKAVRRLGVRPALVLIDGNQPLPHLASPQRSIIKGDVHSACIAAASIIAKVSRDRIMAALERRYPGYGLARHKGYPTPAHLEALRRLGPTAVHRRTFRGVLAAPARPAEPAP